MDQHGPDAAEHQERRDGRGAEAEQEGGEVASERGEQAVERVLAVGGEPVEALGGVVHGVDAPEPVEAVAGAVEEVDRDVPSSTEAATCAANGSAAKGADPAPSGVPASARWPQARNQNVIPFQSRYWPRRKIASRRSEGSRRLRPERAAKARSSGMNTAPRNSALASVA